MRTLVCLALATTLLAADGEAGYAEADGTAGMGVITRPVPLDVQAANGLAPGEGTMVHRVFPWVPSGEASLREGDVLLELNGVPTNSRRDLRAETWSHAPGADFTLTIMRDGRKEVLTGAFGRIPDWLEPRLRLPGERWEGRVEQRQREFLARIEDHLAAAEAAIAADVDRRAADAGIARRGLAPLRYDEGDRDRVILGLIDAGRWSFAYHWSHEAVMPSEVEL